MKPEDRDDALKRLDVDWFIAALANTPFPCSDRAALLEQMHMARVAHDGLPEQMRAESRAFVESKRRG
jgi:hypothetical protein